MRIVVFIFVVLLAGSVVYGQDSTINSFAGGIGSEHKKYFKAELWTTGDDSVILEGWQDEVSLRIAPDEGTQTIDTITFDTLLWTITLASEPAMSSDPYEIEYAFTSTHLTFFFQTFFGVEAASDDSWAIYHDSMMHDWHHADRSVDRYANGKFCNVPRPLLEEDDGDTVTVDSVKFDTAAGTFTIFIDTLQLDTAAYPVALKMKINTTFDPVSTQYVTVYDQSLLLDHLDSMNSGNYTIGYIHQWITRQSGGIGGDSVDMCIAIYDTAYDAGGNSLAYGDVRLDSTAHQYFKTTGKTLMSHALLIQPLLAIGSGGHEALVLSVRGTSTWGFYNDGDYSNDTIIRGGWFGGDLGHPSTSCPHPADIADEEADMGVYEEKAWWGYFEFYEEGLCLTCGVTVTNTYMPGVTIQ